MLRIVSLISRSTANVVKTKCRSFHCGETIILGIESSCDDSCIALVNSNGNVLSTFQTSQELLNSRFRGIVPSLAARSHHLNLPPVLKRVLSTSGLSDPMSVIDAIAVTIGPGIAPCLGEGLLFAKRICKEFSKPLILVDHMESHAMASTMLNDVTFPSLSLLVSGGNTEILYCLNEESPFFKIGDTVDDACGECMDKVYRRICELSGVSLTTVKYEDAVDYDDIIPVVSDSTPANYSKSNISKHGGSQISEWANEFAFSQKEIEGNCQWIKDNKIDFPSPMSRQKNANFSFSGIKTHSIRYLERLDLEGKLDHDTIIRFCFYFERALVRHVVKKLEFAINRHPDIKSLCCGGGVISNHELQRQIRGLCSLYKVDAFFPPPNMCTDNAIMIAWRGVQLWKQKRNIVMSSKIDDVRYDDKLDFSNISEDF